MPPKEEKPKKKRGRKPKPKPKTNNGVKPPPKKRGRKPKGGKIVTKIDIDNKNKKKTIPNVILHLKCSTKDIIQDSISKIEYSPTLENIEAYNKEDNLKVNELDDISSQNNTNIFDNKSFLSLNNNTMENTIITEKKTISKTSKKKDDVNIKNIWNKLRKLKTNLHNNNINDKQCGCFWCTCKFDNPAIHIPKNYKNDKYNVYGCFCSPECACAYLKEEQIDSSTMWERYALLNNLYGKIYNYTKNIKPAPNPYYTLDKFYGNLSIQEYRKLLTNDRLLLIVQKPISKISPDMYEENNEMPVIYSNLLEEKSKIKEPAKKKYRLKSNIKKKTKTNSIQKNFNLV
jgi:hypothetical protein